MIAVYRRVRSRVVSDGRILTLAGVLAMGFFAGGSAPADEDDPPGAAAPDDLIASGEQVTGAVCATACHGWEIFVDYPRQTALQWDYVITDMAGRGAAATEEQLELVRRFLKRVWGTVWINSAGAEELMAVLGLSEGDAAALIAWRGKHGRFTDLESVKAVHGIDAGAIDSQAQAITYD